ncbi:MAG: thiamine pyrophosphate-dependent enzyme, partial [Rhodospirillales bacterium]
HAAGVALAFKIRGEQRAAVSVCGDGATSKGDFYEAINLAGAWQLPVVFVINNNRWAISMPRAKQTAAKTLAQKAIAAGFEGEQVDGDDVIAVRFVMEQALKRARRDGRPHLVEAITYRLTDHTTADDATRYRDDVEVSRHWQEDPLTRLRTYLTAQKVWSPEDEQGLIAETAAAVEQAAEDYLATPPAPPETIFDYVFETLPTALAGQRERVLAQRTENADADG